MKNDETENKINVIVSSILDEFANKNIEREIGITAILKIVIGFIADNCTKEEIKNFMKLLHQEILTTKNKFDSEGLSSLED